MKNSSFHLVLDASVAPAGQPAATALASASGTQPLPLPAEVCFLGMLSDREPQLSTEPLPTAVSAVILEPLTLRDGQLRLLLVNSRNNGLRVNDSHAPRISLLRERDQFQFDDSRVFHVTIFHRPQTGPAPTDKIGKPCPICLAPFSDDENSVCYRCSCGTVLHLRDPSGLECARAVPACPSCRQPISLKEGYSWLPQLDS